MAAKKKSSKGSEKGLTKSGFIRSLPDRTPAKEVIAKAKEAGLELKEKLIWTVQSEMRSEAKGGAKKPAKKSAQATSATASAAGSSAPAAAAKSNGKKGSKKKMPAKVTAKASTVASSSSAEQKMKAIIVQLGTTRADELYRSVRRELDALVAN